MTRVLSILLLVWLLAVPFFFLSGSAHACSCVNADLEREVDDADLVVVGTLLEIVEVNVEPNRTMPYDLTFEVEKYLKGGGSSRVTVREHSMFQGPACSAFPSAEAGMRYLLLLSDNGRGQFGTSSCAGSAAITDENREPMEARIEQIRQIVAGTFVPTAISPTTTPEASPASASSALPESGSGASVDRSNALYIAGAALAGLLGLVGFAAAFHWRGAGHG